MQPIDIDAIAKDFLNVFERIANSLQGISLSLVSAERISVSDSLEKLTTQAEQIVDALHNEDGIGISMVFQDYFDELDKKEKEKED